MVSRGFIQTSLFSEEHLNKILCNNKTLRLVYLSILHLKKCNLKALSDNLHVSFILHVSLSVVSKLLTKLY